VRFTNGISFTFPVGKIRRPAARRAGQATTAFTNKYRVCVDGAYTTGFPTAASGNPAP
jgi:hypothetical protein